MITVTTDKRKLSLALDSTEVSNMVQLKLLIFTLSFYGLVVHLDATCPKGQKRAQGNDCQDCRAGTYQPQDNYSLRMCRACTQCDGRSGSVTVEPCTKERNAKCQCHEGFIPIDSDSSTCQCAIGSGKTFAGSETPKCSKCEDGYFSSTPNSPCKRFKDCKSAGVKRNGTVTSDVVCNEEPQGNNYTTTTPTSNKIVSLTTLLAFPRLREGAQTSKTYTTTTTTSTPGPADIPKTKLPSQPSNTGNHTGMILLVFGIVGLLALTAVTCKLHTTSYPDKHPVIPKSESLCRTPIEESGNGSQLSLKLNPEP